MYEPDFSSYDRALEAIGLERTRENYLWIMYDGNPPDAVDEEVEQALPPDLRLPVE